MVSIEEAARRVVAIWSPARDDVDMVDMNALDSAIAALAEAVDGEGPMSTSPDPAIEPPINSLADRIRHEADVAARPGQYVRLMAIAEELDERAVCDTECDHRPMCPMWEP